MCGITIDENHDDENESDHEERWRPLKLPNFQVGCFALAGGVYPELIQFSIGWRPLGLVIS